MAVHTRPVGGDAPLTPLLNAQRLIAPVAAFREHPAQMRTLYDLDKMVALTLTVYERGLAEWQPLVAAPDGTGGYYLVSGHRRRMARLFAWALETWLTHPDSGIDQSAPVTIETVRDFIGTLVEKYEFVESAAEALAAKFAERELPFVLFEGDAKAQILALQAANTGGEAPDMLGVARSFKAAVLTGASEEEIARNAGVHVHFVRNHLALTELPPELAERIADGELPLSVAVAVAELPEPKRTGLALFIMSNPANRLTAKAIQTCAARLKKWHGLQLPLTVAHQTQRNIARALCRLWQRVVEAYPNEAWAMGASFVYKDQHEHPWEDEATLKLWFQALGGELYWGEDGIQWGRVVRDLLLEVSCATCPIATLPARQLRSDLSPGRSDVLGLPCRAGVAAERCLHGLAPDDPFSVRVPWAWSAHPGVVKAGTTYVVASLADLQVAWQAQAALEDADTEVEAEAPPAGEQGGDDTSQTAVPGQPPSAPSQALSRPAAGPSPVQQMRALIADYMARHRELAADHPLATPCHRCQHRLEGSPTKAERVPPCAWASRLRTIEIKVLEPTEGSGPRIPLCRQFAPRERWAETIPEHPAPGVMPREWLKHQILELNKTHRHYAEKRMFEWLTGRPMGATEKHDNWFETQLNEQVGDLSDGQLWTLLVWALAEWRRRGDVSPTFWLPTSGTSSQFLPYREVVWRLARPEEGEYA
jgi:hypothetical protein